MANNVTINISAGTARYNRQLDEAKAKMRDTFGHGSVSSIQATSASLRLLEGNMTNNIRATERFLAQTLKLGPVLQAAFPLIGGLAFLAFLGEISQKAYKFFKDIENAPEKMRGAFADMNQGLVITNDALQVSNARLQNEIATLSGKPENNLKVALLEAKEAADKLNQSLEKDISSAYKLVEEHTGSWFKRFGAGVLGKAGTKDIELELGGETGEGGFKALTRGLKTEDLVAAYKAEIDKFEHQIRNAQHAGKPDIKGAFLQDFLGNTITGDMKGRLEILKGELFNLQQALKEITNTTTNSGLVKKAAELQDKNNKEALERPFDNKMDQIEARIDGIQAKMSAIGGTNQDSIIAAGTAEASKDIEEVTKAMKRKHEEITDLQRLMIFQRDLDAAAIASDEAWRKKFTDNTDAIDERIKQQKILNSLNLNDYAARRNAATESTLKGMYKDEYGSPERAADIAKDRIKLNEEADLVHQRALQLKSSELATQITLYTRMAQVAGDFSKTHQAQMDAEIAKMREQGVAENIIAQRIEEETKKLEYETAARAAADRLSTQGAQRSAAAAFGGLDARQEAEIQNKIEEAKAHGAQADEISALRSKMEADYRLQIIDAAGKAATADSERATILDRQISALKAQIALHGTNLEMQHALKDLEDQRLDVAIKMQLHEDSALAGVRAFFLEMEKQAERTSQMIYDSLNEVLNKTSDNMAKIMTGNVGKGGIGKLWGDTFKGIGEDLSRSVIHSGLQRGLGAIGAHFPGLDKVLGVGKPDGTSEHPFHVIVQGGGAGGGNAVPNPLGGILKRKGGIFGGGDLGGGIFSLLDTATGGGSDTERESSGGTSSYTYNIDARGAQVGVEARIGQAIEAAHNSAVRNSVLVAKQQQIRLPQLAGGGGANF